MRFAVSCFSYSVVVATPPYNLPWHRCIPVVLPRSTLRSRGIRFRRSARHPKHRSVTGTSSSVLMGRAYGTMATVPVARNLYQSHSRLPSSLTPSLQFRLWGVASEGCLGPCFGTPSPQAVLGADYLDPSSPSGRPRLAQTSSPRDVLWHKTLRPYVFLPSEEERHLYCRCSDPACVHSNPGTAR